MGKGQPLQSELSQSMCAGQAYNRQLGKVVGYRLKQTAKHTTCRGKNWCEWQRCMPCCWLQSSQARPWCTHPGQLKAAFMLSQTQGQVLSVGNIH